MNGIDMYYLRVQNSNTIFGMKEWNGIDFYVLSLYILCGYIIDN